MAFRGIEFAGIASVGIMQINAFAECACVQCVRSTVPDQYSNCEHGACSGCAVALICTTIHVIDAGPHYIRINADDFNGT